MKLRFAPRAKADIAEIHAYIADRNPKAAKAVVRRIKTTAELLAQYPGVGRITDIASVRVLAAAPFPYLLYYTHTSSTVVITHVRHGAREAPLPDDL
jgi:toxin ParE1/3/4